MEIITIIVNIIPHLSPLVIFLGGVATGLFVSVVLSLLLRKLK